MATIKEFTILQSSDDAACRSDDGTQYSDTDVSLWLGKNFLGSGNEPMITGLRFQAVNIPSGSTITAAYVKLYSTFEAASGTVNIKIYAEAADNSVTFSSGSKPNARTKTSAFADWSAINFDLYQYHNSPDLTQVVQEVVNRAGWNEANALTILLDDNNSTDFINHRFLSFDSFPGLTAVLHIEYDDPLTTAAARRVRHPVQSVRVSWKKQIQNSFTLFTIGVSSIGGGDYIPFSGSIISDWNKFIYFDESENVTQLSHEHTLNLPLGGAVRQLADVTLRNESGRYLPDYMGGNSELFTALLPSRPIIINTGFEFNGVDVMEPQFVGVLRETPEVNIRNREVELHAADFINFLSNKQVDAAAMFTGVYADTAIANILSTLGFATAQYELDQGLNQISFAMLPAGTKYIDFIDEIVKAENGHFYQDEQGILQFANRQRWTQSPHNSVQEIISTVDVLDAIVPDDDHIINIVNVTSSPRKKQATAQIYSLVSPIQLDPEQTEVFISFDNPVLAASAPSYTVNSSSDGSGSNLTASVSILHTDLFAQAVKYRFHNSSGQVGYITALTIDGREATVTEQIFHREVDGSSLTAYDERLLEINNDYIQDRSWAQSYALLMLNRFSEPDSLQEITIRAKPNRHIGDLISWQGIAWRIFGIRNKMSVSDGYLQDLLLFKDTQARYFTIGVSQIGGGDQIAA